MSCYFPACRGMYVVEEELLVLMHIIIDLSEEILSELLQIQPSIVWIKIKAGLAALHI